MVKEGKLSFSVPGLQSANLIKASRKNIYGLLLVWESEQDFLSAGVGYGRLMARFGDVFSDGPSTESFLLERMDIEFAELL